MSDVNTQISLLHVDFSRHYLSLFGCMSSVKTLLFLVGLRQVCSPYSAQLRCYSFVSIRISWLFKKKYTNLVISCEWCLQSLLSIDQLEVEHESFLYVVAPGEESGNYYEIAQAAACHVNNLSLLGFSSSRTGLMNVLKCWDAKHVFHHLARVICALRDCTDRM